MKLPPSPNSIFSRIKNRIYGVEESEKPSYEELERRVLELEEEVARKRWTAGLLWENEEMFNKAFRENPDAVAILRTGDAAIIDVNPGFYRMLNYTAEEVAGKTPDELGIWVNPRERRDFMSQLNDNGQVIGLEARFRTRDGELVYGMISAWPIEILGEPCVLAITRNLTDRKRADQILRIQRDLGIDLSEARDLKQAATRILRASFNVHGIDCGGVYLVDSLTGALDMITYSGFPRSFAAKVRHYPTDSPQARLVRAGKPVYGLYKDFSEDEDPDPGNVLAMAIVPVEYEGQVVASIHLGSHSQEHIPKGPRNAIEGIAARMGGVVARLEAEAALAESEERFATFMDTLPGMAFMKDENGHFIYTNLHMAEIFGKKKWIGLPMSRLFDEKTAERFVSEDQQVMAEGPMETIGTIPDKEGRERAYRTFKFPILREGKPKILGGIAVEITRQVEAERQLMSALQQLRAVFDTFPGGVKVVDRDYMVLDVSDRLLEMHGLTSKEEVVGRKCHRVFHGRRKPCPFCSVPAAIQGDSLVTRLMAEGEFKNTDQDFKAYTHPIKDDRGNIWGAVECVMDVTDLKEAEKRTRAALHEKELLLKEVHHRVKNNMQVISALLTIQAARMDDQGVKRAFADMQNRIKAMALVHETLYKAENLAEIDLADYARTVAESLFHAFGAKERGIALEIEAEGVTFGVDHAVPCGMIINELFTNALKHAFPEDGPGAIRLSARRLDKKNMELVIADTGQGIPKDLNPAKATTLGLGLVGGLVENQLGGTIKMDTRKGTCFTMRFPG